MEDLKGGFMPFLNQRGMEEARFMTNFSKLMSITFLPAVPRLFSTAGFRGAESGRWASAGSILTVFRICDFPQIQKTRRFLFRFRQSVGFLNLRDQPDFHKS